MRLDVKYGGKGVEELLGDLREMSPALQTGLFRAAETLRGHIVRSIRERLNPEGRRTGNLMRSFRPSAVVNDAGKMQVGVFSDLVYARIQDEGGTINARPGGALTIPIADMPIGTTARDFADAFILRANGKAYLVRSIGKGKLEFLYQLVRSVTLRGKGYLEAAETSAATDVERDITEAIDAHLETGGA